MSGEFLTQTLGAGATMQFQKAGKYFEVIADGGGTFNFTFYGPNGAQTSNWKNCQSGTFIEDPYSAFDITNNAAAAQAITLLLMDNGRGGSRRTPGNVRVIDEITDGITYAFPAPTTAIAAYAVFSTIVAPASNVNGLIVRQASANTTSGAAGTSYSGIIACRSAPTGYQVPLQRYTIADAFSSAQQNVTVSFNMNKMLPPGWGLYCVKEVTGSVAGALNATVAYELK